MPLTSAGARTTALLCAALLACASAGVAAEAAAVVAAPESAALDAKHQVKLEGGDLTLVVSEEDVLKEYETWQALLEGKPKEKGTQ